MSVVINGDTGISGVNGHAGNPAIKGGDADTGIHFGTNTASVSTGGTTRLHVDADGNIGIGTTPSGLLNLGYVLRLNGGGAQTFLAFNNSTHTTQGTGGFVLGNDGSAAYITQREDQPLLIATNNTTRLKINQAGAVALSDEDPVDRLHIKSNNSGGDVALRIQNDNVAADSTASIHLVTSTTDTFNSATIRADRNSGDMMFERDNNVRMRISDTGQVGIARDPQELLDLGGVFRSDALTNLTYGYPTKLVPLKITQFGDYQRQCIALAYKHPGGSTKVNLSGFWGRIYAVRGSSGAGHHSAILHCHVSTAYNAQHVGGMAQGSGVFRFVTFTYDSTDYVGVQFNVDSSAQIWLDGYYFRLHGFKPFAVSKNDASNITSIGANQISRFATSAAGNI